MTYSKIENCDNTCQIFKWTERHLFNEKDLLNYQRTTYEVPMNIFKDTIRNLVKKKMKVVK